MKVVSFNVNSIRARLHQLQKVIEKHEPAIIGLQETKVADEEFPEADIHSLGYQVAFHGQKTHYGVALLYKQAPLALMKGLPDDSEDEQKRLVCGSFRTADGRELTVINGYFPQGENRSHPVKFPKKAKFYQDVTAHIERRHPEDSLLLVMGDMNIAPEDADVGIGAENMKRWLRDGKTCFLPEEREWFSRLNDLGLRDVYRHQYPQADSLYSWFDYRSKGFEREPKRGLRIDLILASKPALERSVAAGIDYDIRAMDRPSDHCPVWAEFDLAL